jgi:hypothetical protein
MISLIQAVGDPKCGQRDRMVGSLTLVRVTFGCHHGIGARSLLGHLDPLRLESSLTQFSLAKIQPLSINLSRYLNVRYTLP